MKLENIKPGIAVRAKKLESTDGMIIHRAFLKTRIVGAEGKVLKYVPGHGGDVWLVEQANGIAAYCYTELEQL